MPSLNFESLTNIRAPNDKRIALRITPAAERALREGHPWLFESAITHQSKQGHPGDLAVIFDKRRDFLAIGLYDPTSPIRVRVLAHNQPVPIDAQFFEAKLRKAVRIRDVLRPNTTGYRLVHGGNEGFPGLIIDRYAKTLVLKLYTPAWLPHLADVLTGLVKIMPCDQIVLRLSRVLQQHPQWLFGLQDGAILAGTPATDLIRFRENGLWFEADPLRGHKTGFYLDQRDNRARVATLAAGKSVLNVFAYTGGFSIYAAHGGADRVASLDISRPALAAAERNFAYNQDDPRVRACTHKSIAGDAFEVMSRLQVQGRIFDLIIIDPPSFAKSQSQVSNAISAYRQLTRMGLSLLKAGGTLVQASCSSRVKPDAFFPAIHGAANQAGRPLQEIERTFHPLDHPVGFKEGAYLKCLFATT